MKNYKRLSDVEREEINRMLAQDYSFQDIARQLDRCASTISREVGRGNCNKYTYRAAKTQNRARRNASKRRSGKFRLDREQALRRYIYKKLKLKWSPVQIAEELEKDYPDNMEMRISPEAIYTYIYVLPRGALKKELTVCLRRNHKRETPTSQRRQNRAKNRGYAFNRRTAERSGRQNYPRTLGGRPDYWKEQLFGSWHSGGARDPRDYPRSG
ncbi:MAG: hypothetical protein COT61_01350 [Candidatus Portnoybacteria bacterium CG09_land_8_20_14_0_10_44_13]|uniref:Transposase IS30-like HTH domain-containing protein n=3 Tax=Candidatus Portnoyibacteriota TaxID=1817913 RepID=A0A2H0WW69_9BACT|nr:MAG: hypothetical protein COT61_01350 [Candidatus Portnoybacteria bacterium CG09_land_8_20_14_0_10_44_13]PIZ68926.1 MAG: hypothetical protein COY11_05265 [Candidatus Portnoybacteria bacterium CG_4_10_14_0_2_um_filter_44_20]PJA63457.1 MAG: hypothetical protein CO161_00940 [Candidatus Portnoybacteria bacterium CG_4_9_14_3_um_filter_44_9]